MSNRQIGTGGLIIILSVDSPYAAGWNEEVILADTSGGNIEVDLPAVSSVGFRKTYQFGNIGSGDLTIDPSGSELLNGSSSSVVIAAGAYMTVVTDNVAWYQIG